MFSIGVLSSYRFLPLYFSKCKYNRKGKSFLLREKVFFEKKSQSLIFC